MIDFAKLRHAVRYRCERQGLTQKELSQKLGFTEVGFKRMFDNSTLKLSTLQEVATLLKTDIYTLLQDAQNDLNKTEK